MSIYSILYYLFSLTLATITILVSFQLHRKYGLPYLTSFFYYIISFNILGFLIWNGPFIAQEILKNSHSETIRNIRGLFDLLSVPFWITALFFFITFLKALMENSISKNFKRGFLIFSIVFFIIKFVSILDFFKGGQTPLQFISGWFIGFITMSAQFIFIIDIFFKLRFIGEAPKRKAVKIIGILFLIGYSAFMVVEIGYLNNYYHIDITPIFFFLLNLPPLLYLKNFLAGYYRQHPLPQRKIHDLESFFSRYNITAREKEIVELIISGKDYNEIGKELYISLSTVKGHLHNIYKKLGIKNRIQLSNLIQNYQIPKSV